jgi:hypothetical protein
MNRNLTIGLVAVFAVLVLFVVLVQRPRDQAASATPTTRATEYLWALTADQVRGLRLEDRANGRAVELAQDAAGVWTVVEPGPQAAEQNAAAAAVSGLTSLTLNATLTATTDLAPFGVLSPAYRLSVSLADGRTLAAAIGDKAPTGSTYYVLREGEAVVVTVNAFGLDSIIGLLDNPPLPPTATPEVTPTAEGAEATAEDEQGDITPEPTVSPTP